MKFAITEYEPARKDKRIKRQKVNNHLPLPIVGYSPDRNRDKKGGEWF